MLPGRLLQSLAKEITPVVHFIFTQSLCTGELPTDWTQANVAPIFKKGSKLQAVNYRPISLTCITCKLFEHIICNFSKAFDTVPHDGILSILKHYDIDEKIWLWIYNFLKKQETKCRS